MSASRGRIRLPVARVVGVSPAGVEYVARFLGDAAILRARLADAWARHAARRAGRR